MTMILSPSNYVHHTAQQAIQAGMSVVPIRTDGSKQPALVSWRQYQQRRATLWEIDRWFGRSEVGIAFVTGYASGSLEALDFDDRDTFEAWLHLVHNDAALSTLYEHLATGYFETTPSGGRHLLYRCASIEGNQKLATRSDRRKTLIETRGEGGLIIVAPSRGRVHPTGKPYILQRGSVSSIRTITTDQRSLIFASARSFDETPSAKATLPPRKMLTFTGNGLRPGDLFNQTATWEEILIPHGWKLVRVVNGEGYWCRPEKSSGISATTNHSGYDTFYVFSTSTLFEAGRGYTKFHAYTLLNHGGDFQAAARALAETGHTDYQTTKHYNNTPDLRKPGTQERKHL